MTPRKEVVLDKRRRTSLARVGRKDHSRYLVEEYDNGTIVLTPAVMVSETEYNMLRNPEVIAALKVAEIDDPATRLRI